MSEFNIIQNQPDGWRAKLQLSRAPGTNMKRTIPEKRSKPVSSWTSLSPAHWRAKLQLSRSVGLMLTKTVGEHGVNLNRVDEYRHWLS